VKQRLRFEYRHSRGTGLAVKEISYPDCRIWTIAFPK
jgi:hypothetical protein